MKLTRYILYTNFNFSDEAKMVWSLSLVFPPHLCCLIIGESSSQRKGELIMRWDSSTGIVVRSLILVSWFWFMVMNFLLSYSSSSIARNYSPHTLSNYWYRLNHWPPCTKKSKTFFTTILVLPIYLHYTNESKIISFIEKNDVPLYNLPKLADYISDFILIEVLLLYNIIKIWM